MFNTNSLALGALAVTALMSGAVIVTAQQSPFVETAEPTVSAPQMPEMLLRADHRRQDRGRGPSLGALLSDADGDGTITSEEIDLARAALMAGADASGNGDISLEEYQAIFVQLMQDQMVDSFQDLDADGSGEITEAEFDAALDRIVDRLDRNDDGNIGTDDRRSRNRT